jgi:hypothetical protein
MVQDGGSLCVSRGGNARGFAGKSSEANARMGGDSCCLMCCAEHVAHCHSPRSRRCVPVVCCVMCGAEHAAHCHSPRSPGWVHAFPWPSDNGVVAGPPVLTSVPLHSLFLFPGEQGFAHTRPCTDKHRHLVEDVVSHLQDGNGATFRIIRLLLPCSLGCSPIFCKINARDASMPCLQDLYCHRVCPQSDCYTPRRQIWKPALAVARTLKPGTK